MRKIFIVILFLTSSCSMALHPKGHGRKKEHKKQDLYAMVIIYMFSVWVYDNNK